MTATLLDPLRLPCGVTLKNRLLKSAMTEGLADSLDRPTPAHEALYRAWDAGGCGTLLTGNVMVDRRYLERPGNVVVEDESVLPELRSWASSAPSSALVMQISHPGRQCSRVVTSQPVAPSAVQLQLGGLFARPRALREEEIEDIIERFARVAGLAQRAGFAGVQVHGAHGYLSSQFLSPRTNQRTDAWGGSLVNRARFLRRVVQAVRQQVGQSFPVFVKLNSSDFQKGAFTLEDACQVAAWLSEDGIDLLEISGGTYERLRLFGIEEPGEARAESTLRREAYFLEYAAALRAAIGRTPLAITGGFRSASAMRSALAEGLVDVVGLARPLCVEPDLPDQLLSGESPRAPDHERRLRLGPGFFGPASSSVTMRGLNAQAGTAWYYAQIYNMAAGKPPPLELSAGRALLDHYLRELRVARARRTVPRLPAQT